MARTTPEHPKGPPEPQMKEQSEPQIEIVHEDDESAYSQDGVDLTLIRWMLSLSPLERLGYLESTIDSIRQLRGELDEEN